jgi:tetratricopeptide (TPR) repeat protein
VDLLGEYEARLFRASSLIYMKKYQEAEEILDAMSSNENYKDWEGSLLAEKMRLYRLSGKDSLFIDSEKKADTYSGNPNIAAMYFEKGMEYFRKNDYVKSRIYFAKSRGAKSPVARAANEYYTLLNEMETNKIEIHKTNQLVKKNVPITDTVKTLTAARYFAVGRVFEKIGKHDSALHYFYKAADSCPQSSPERAQFLYSIHRKIKDSLPTVADSLMEIMATTYGKTEYGKEARVKLGFTELAEIDTAGDYYNSGSRFRLTGNDSLAIRQYKTVFKQFPQSKYAARSLYAVGWIFERKLLLLDSAIFYYKKLVADYPMSDYALEVAPSLSAWDQKRVPPRPDSLQQKAFQSSTISGQQQSVDTLQSQSNTIQVVTDPNVQSMPVDNVPDQKDSSFPLKLPTSLKDVLKMDIPSELPKLDSFNPFKSKSDTTKNSRQDTVPSKKKP